MSIAVRSGRTYEVFVAGKPVGLVGSTIHSLAHRRKCGNEYVKRFGPTVELRLIREVPVPEGYDEQGYTIRLRAAEAFDIARRKTYREDGGLNKVSPLIQVLWETEGVAARGRLGGQKNVESGQIRALGFKQGKKNVESGFIQALGKIQGRKNVESGLARDLGNNEKYKEAKIRGGHIGGRIGGRKAVEDKLGIFGMNSEARHAARRKSGLKAVADGRFKVLLETEHARQQKTGTGIHAPGVYSRAGRIGGRIGMCLRWKIRRGKECVCGKH